MISEELHSKHACGKDKRNQKKCPDTFMKAVHVYIKGNRRALVLRRRRGNKDRKKGLVSRIALNTGQCSGQRPTRFSANELCEKVSVYVNICRTWIPTLCALRFASHRISPASTHNPCRFLTLSLIDTLNYTRPKVNIYFQLNNLLKGNNNYLDC